MTHRAPARAGVYHPTVSSPCECHYQGTLIDGTKFDSSYDRGSPTTFAPNQVIKGWTEAMQLMVEGDKWEMYGVAFRRTIGRVFRPPIRAHVDLGTYLPISATVIEAARPRSVRCCAGRCCCFRPTLRCGSGTTNVSKRADTPSVHRRGGYAHLSDGDHQDQGRQGARSALLSAPRLIGTSDRNCMNEGSGAHVRAQR